MARPPFQNEHLYAVEQERIRHDDALHWYGEMTACVMFWAYPDFRKGDVGRCSVCYTPYGIVADAYKQPSKSNCPNCYGTTFEGGIRAIVYRPVLWQEDSTSKDIRPRGHTMISSGTAQVTSDINMRDGDYLVRQDRTRWIIAEPQVSEIANGFGPTGLQMAPGSVFQVQLEDQSAIAYSIPVDQDALNLVGWKPYMLYPHPSDIVNGSLVIDDFAP